MIKLKIQTHRTNLDKFLPSYKKVSEIFQSPNIVLVNKSSIKSNCAHFWCAVSNLDIIGDEIKKWTEQTILDKFSITSKTVSALDEA